MGLKHTKGYLSVRLPDQDRPHLITISIMGPRGGHWGSINIRPEDAAPLAQALKEQQAIRLEPPQHHKSTVSLTWVEGEALLISRSGDFREWEGATLDPLEAEELAETIRPSDIADSSLSQLI